MADIIRKIEDIESDLHLYDQHMTDCEQAIDQVAYEIKIASRKMRVAKAAGRDAEVAAIKDEITALAIKAQAIGEKHLAIVRALAGDKGTA